MAQAFVYHASLPERLNPGFQLKFDVVLTGDDVKSGGEQVQGLVQLRGTESDVDVSNAIISAVQTAASEMGLSVASTDITLPNWQRRIT